jgi:hypothetical protein
MCGRKMALNIIYGTRRDMYLGVMWLNVIYPGRTREIYGRESSAQNNAQHTTINFIHHTRSVYAGGASYIFATCTYKNVFKAEFVLWWNKHDAVYYFPCLRTHYTLCFRALNRRPTHHLLLYGRVVKRRCEKCEVLLCILFFS